MKSGAMIVAMLLVFSNEKSAAQKAEKTEKIIQQGNELYKQKQYTQAQGLYQQAIDKEPLNATAKFNQSVAIYRQTKPDEAIKTLEELVMNTNDKDVKSKSFYNKGVILSGQKKLEESIESYKDALRQNPADKDARENLQKALLELKKKNPPKKEENKKKDQQQKKQQQQQQPKMNKKEAEQRLKLLEQKEKEVQQRLQKEKSKQGGGQPKDW